MMYGKCVTNIDAFKRKRWIEYFCGVPNIGDKVYTKDEQSYLYVVSVSHKNIEDRPYLRIELHYPKDGLSFNEHERLGTGNP